MIPREVIDKIFETCRIEEIIGDFVALKKRGVNLLGLCPFHNEKTPSFTVSPTKGIYKCFGCGKGGNSINFVMDHEHYNYPEALRYIAEKYNIEIPEKAITSKDIERSNEKTNLFAISKFANSYYQKTLWETTEGEKIGLSYLKQRGYSDETILQFELGYSLKKKNAFSHHAIISKFEEKNLKKSGLSLNSNDLLRDRFRERIIFPIHNFTGRVLGFGARTLNNQEKAKYLNSPESPIYYKSKVLYGIFFAKKDISKKDNCFIVEGYTDVISLYQKDVKNVVSSSGTSLTKEQIKIISRFTKNITILFDGDNAGIKASFRSINMILKEGLNVKLVLFPEGEDPDSYSKKLSKNDFISFLESEAQDFITFKTTILNNEKQTDPTKRAEIIKDIVTSISVIPNYLIRMEYAKTCSKILDIKEEYLVRELNQERKKIISSNVEVESTLIKNVDSKNSPSELQKLELELLRIIFNYGNNLLGFEGGDISVASFIIKELNLDNISLITPLYNDAFNCIKKQLLENNRFNPDFFINNENFEFNTLAANMLGEKHNISVNWEKKHNIFTRNELDKIKKTTQKAILLLKLFYVSQRIKKIQLLLKNETAKNPDLKMLTSLMKIKKEIHNKLSS